MSDVGGANTITNQNITFSDGGSAISASLATGTYSPTNSGSTDIWVAPGPGSITQASPTLSSFSGNMNGEWKLFVVDDSTANAGKALGWSITFSAPNNITYTWSPSTGLSSTTGASVIASPSSNQTYTVSVNDGASACNPSSTVTVNVSGTAPSIPTNVSATTATTINIGGTVTFTADGNGNTINWYNQAEGGSPIGSGSTYTTSTQCSTGTFTVYGGAQPQAQTFFNGALVRSA
jgi:hypothetical protein